LKHSVAFACLFSDDRRTGARANLVTKLGDGVDDVAGFSGALDDTGDQLGIAAGGCEDDGAGFSNRA